MSRIVALQMDPIESVNPGLDSTYALGLQAQARGFSLYHYHPTDLFFRDGVIGARARPLRLREGLEDFYALGAVETIDLSTVDAVLLRQDPPFDLGYITTTHLLEQLSGRTLVVNDPAEVRNAPEKLFVTEFTDLIPPTLISADPGLIRDFRAEHGDIILKPLFGNGGAGVFRIRPEDENFQSLLETMAGLYLRQPLIAQRYIPAVRAGDKRIILADGEIAGHFIRVPAKGEARSNMHVGGVARPCELTARDFEICERLKPELQRRNLIFTGIDVIGDYLTEINVTSPTGLWEAKALSGSDAAAMVWKAIEKKL